MTNDQMSKLDKMIESALTEEDKELLESTRELGYLDLGLNLFSGRSSWINWTIMILQIVMFVLAAWCGYKFYYALDVLVALKWGIACASLAIMALQVKLSLIPHMQADRIVREIKRVELLLATMDK